MTTAEDYRTFARHTHHVSPSFEAWALGVAGDPEVRALIETLPEPKRQPNLLFAAARAAGAKPDTYDDLRQVLLHEWGTVRATALTRSTQTNEAGRCATLLPLLAALPQPLALLEVGASAGLCLQPDRYSYRYGDLPAIHPAGGESAVLLDCAVLGRAPVPDRVPQIAWRAGLDLNPLDVRDDDEMRWLETLVWPEHDHRRSRLAGAIAIARQDPPRVVAGDLNDDLARLAGEVPAGATLVVYHSAVLTYLAPEDRARFVATVTEIPGHWISNEGPGVLPAVTATAGRAARSDGEAFVTALDGRAMAWSGPHGQFLDWL